MRLKADLKVRLTDAPTEIIAVSVSNVSASAAGLSCLPAEHARKPDGDAGAVARRARNRLEPELEDLHRLDMAHRAEASPPCCPNPAIQLG